MVRRESNNFQYIYMAHSICVYMEVVITEINNYYSKDVNKGDHLTQVLTL